MKDRQERIVAATAEPVAGSPSVNRGGINISDLYMDMLCERYRNRGIKTGATDPARRAKIEKQAGSLGLSMVEDQERQAQYRTLQVDGRSYMSHDDFAAYYRESRGFKLPAFYSRAEDERGSAGAGKNVQESGKPPKKAKWLAVKRRVSSGTRDFLDSYIVGEVRDHFKEEVKTGYERQIPKGILPVFAAVTVSLLLIVCSSVMVSRGTQAVGKLEDKIDRLYAEKEDLRTDLEVKNNMLDIKKIAVEEYGMISADYAASRYLELGEDEKIEIYEEKEKDESLLSQLLRAIGLKSD